MRTLLRFAQQMRRRDVVAGGLFVALLLALGPLSVQPAHASIGPCRDDPVVHFTNGGSLRLSTVIQTDAASVQQVAYTVSVPQGLVVSHVTYTGGALADKVTVEVSANAPAGVYRTDTLVSTGGDSVPVTVRSSVPSAGSAEASGTSGQHLVVTVSG